MDMKPTDDNSKIDPLHRVLIPIERHGYFQTTDNRQYRRAADGSIRREFSKATTKAARKANKAERRRLSKLRDALVKQYGDGSAKP